MVRVGGRSASEKIAALSLRERRQQMIRGKGFSRTTHMAVRETKEKLQKLESELRTDDEVVLNLNKQIIKEEVLREAIQRIPDHWRQLMSYSTRYAPP